MKTVTQPIVFKSISALLRALEQPIPTHPLIAVVNYDQVGINREIAGQKNTANIAAELATNIDAFSQDVLVSQF